METGMKRSLRKRQIIKALLMAVLLTALWSTPSYAEPDSAELDLAKGDIVITNAGYTQGDGSTVSHDGSYVITSSGTKPVSHTVTIQSDLADITLKDVNAASKESPISLGSSFDHAMVRLHLDGTNILQSIEGDHAGIFVPEGAFLVFEDSVGSLSVTGSGTGAGIGGSGKAGALEGTNPENCGNITIHGGIITATGGSGGGSGIGGAVKGAGGNIEITGGSVTAAASTAGTGMGSSPLREDKEKAGKIYIVGGTVKVNGSLGTAGDMLSGTDEGVSWVESDRMGAELSSFSGVLFQGGKGRFYGNKNYVLEQDRVIPAGSTLTADADTVLEIREGACLTVNGELVNEGSLRLAAEDCMKQGKEGKLSGRGRFTVPGITADMISVPDNLVYDNEEGEDITESILGQIELNRKRRGRKELFGVEFTVIPDFTGWDTKEIDWPVIESGEYTVTYSKAGQKSLSKRFMVYSPGEAERSGLASIKVFQKPFKMVYSYGDDFDSTDLIVVGTYEDGSVRNVTPLVHVEWESFDIGVHTVKITCAREDERQELQCLLEGITIVAKDIDVSNMHWEITEFVYDGTEKTVSLEGSLPEGVIASRTTSSGTEAGSYKAAVYFSLSGSLDKEHYTIVGPNPMEAEWRIEPKELAWDTTGLSAAGQAGESFDKHISLYGVLGVTGILSQDQEETESQWPASRLEGYYEGTEPGEQEIALSWKTGREPSVGENYCLPKEMPVITGTINDVKALPEAEELAGTGKNYRQEMESGISHVPDALMEIPKLSSPKGIETRMRTAVTEKDSGILITNTNVYDLRLLVQKEDDTWEKAAGEVFPESGITVTLPYPGNTDKGGPYEFTVAHMYTEKKGKYEAGDIEYLETVTTPEGIQFHVTSLSPVSIGWRADTAGAAKGESEDSGLLTGDTVFVMVCVLMGILAFAAIAVIVRLGILPRLKKPKKKKKDVPQRHIDYRA